MKNSVQSILLAAICVAMTGCATDSYRRAEGVVWTTAYHITYCSPYLLDDSITATLNVIDSSLSAFNDESLVSAVNRGDTTVRADRLLRTVMEGSLTVWQHSGGRFDPTLGPAISLWGFGPGHKAASVSDAAVDSVRALVGMGDCSITADGRIVKKSPLTQFNFSAIAKGLACDEVAAMLERNGSTDYLVEIGGEIRLRGVNSRGEPWRIMIEAPSVSSTERPGGMMAITPGEGGMATSGNYRNYRDTPGGRVGHTIDPATCRPAESRLLSATVIAPTAMLADALATACMTSDAASARQMIERLEGAGAIVLDCDSTLHFFGSAVNFRN